MGLANILTGCLVALVVNVMHAATDQLSSRRFDLVDSIRSDHGILQAWAVHLGCALGFASVAFACVLAVPQARGSGLPQLLAYLNGCKLHGFTSIKVIVAKVVGTSCALAAGLFCGPEGPIIHVGACCGKLLLQMIQDRGVPVRYQAGSTDSRKPALRRAHLRALSSR